MLSWLVAQALSDLLGEALLLAARLDVAGGAADTRHPGKRSGLEVSGQEAAFGFTGPGRLEFCSSVPDRGATLRPISHSASVLKRPVQPPSYGFVPV